MISARQAQKERERKEKEQKHTWVSDWAWEDIMGFLWVFGNSRLVKKEEEGTQTVGEVGGLTEEESIYCKTFKTAALKIGLVDGPKWDRSHVKPEYLELFDEIEKGCKDLQKELRAAKTTEDIAGLVGIDLRDAGNAAEAGDHTTSARLYKKAGTTSTRLQTAKNYIRGAITYVYFLRSRGYNVHDMGPDTLKEYLGTPEHGFKDGVLQKVQHKYKYVKNTEDKVGWYYSERQMQNMSKFAKDFAREVLVPAGVFDALNEDGVRVVMPAFTTGQELDSAKPTPYRITLDKYLSFPKTIYTKSGKLLPDVNEILLIYNAIHKIKSGWGERDPMNKFVENRCLYEILIRIVRESGARPANIRWLKWEDFVTDEMHPYISWVGAHKAKEPGKLPPKITYLSSVLADMIDAYRGTRGKDPKEFFIRDEFFVRKKAKQNQPIDKDDLTDITTNDLQEIVETAYKNQPAVIATLGKAVGAKRFRKSLATLLFKTIKDTAIIPTLTGDTLETLEEFYTEDASATNPLVKIDRGAKERYTAYDITNRIFDKELPPGVTRGVLVNSCKLKKKKKKK